MQQEEARDRRIRAYARFLGMAHTETPRGDADWRGVKRPRGELRRDRCRCQDRGG
jgi:hypothetical protein